MLRGKMISGRAPNPSGPAPARSARCPLDGAREKPVKCAVSPPRPTGAEAPSMAKAPPTTRPSSTSSQGSSQTKPLRDRTSDRRQASPTLNPTAATWLQRPRRARRHRRLRFRHRRIDIALLSDNDMPATANEEIFDVAGSAAFAMGTPHAWSAQVVTPVERAGDRRLSLAKRTLAFERLSSATRAQHAGDGVAIEAAAMTTAVRHRRIVGVVTVNASADAFIRSRIFGAYTPRLTAEGMFRRRRISSSMPMSRTWTVCQSLCTLVPEIDAWLTLTTLLSMDAPGDAGRAAARPRPLDCGDAASRGGWQLGQGLARLHDREIEVVSESQGQPGGSLTNALSASAMRRGQS